MRRLCYALLAVLAAGPLFAQGPPPKDAREKTSPQLLSIFTDVVAAARPSTVRVRLGEKDAALGTIVGADGWVLTKASLLGDGPVSVMVGSTPVLARVVGVKDDYDLAMLKVDVSGLKPIEFQTSKQVDVGGWVATPGIGPLPAAIGVVSVASRELPLVRSFPGANSGFLGVAQADPIETERPSAKIGQIEPGTPAAKAGLKAGDIIMSVDGLDIKGFTELRETLMKRKVGDVVVLRFQRDGEVIERKATLGKRPAGSPRGDFQNSMGSTLSERRIGFPWVLQHDTVLKPTECGGPLVNLDGQVVGVNIARAGRTESYAIPAEKITPILYDLMSGKLAPPEAKVKNIPSAKDRLSAAETNVARLKAAKETTEKDLGTAEAELKKAKQALDAEQEKEKKDK